MKNDHFRGPFRDRTPIVFFSYVVYLIVDKAPLLEEGVNPHNGAYVAGQVAATSRTEL